MTLVDDRMSFSSVGKRFQARGAATENARSPNRHSVRGRKRLLLLEARSDERVDTVTCPPTPSPQRILKRTCLTWAVLQKVTITIRKSAPVPPYKVHCVFSISVGYVTTSMSVWNGSIILRGCATRWSCRPSTCIDWSSRHWP